MRSGKWLLVVATLMVSSTYAQKKAMIDGRARLLDGRSVPVTIENRSSKEIAVVDQTGYYMITAQKGDTLRFTSKFSVTSDYVVEKQDIKKGRVNVVLAKPGQNLEEIIIIKKDFGPDFFGKSDEQILSPAEANYSRRNTLTSATPSGGLGISVDALVNLFSGQRKKDKEAIVYERLEIIVKDFVEKYPKEDLTKDLSIPSEQVDAFLYYLAAQADIQKIPVDRSEGYQLLLAQYYDEFLIFTGLKP
ncbi:hypothetical protein NWE55_12950 [Myroides albus]|uniref:hypothetical protein n=1 Tax=Myroides albus TaxID=2562892 RepID=UPI0021595534|nr:hypothetical protein [Myroides albus]UVD79023.1 hypothetical protein NWE55_12950 [Myroides albus]